MKQLATAWDGVALMVVPVGDGRSILLEDGVRVVDSEGADIAFPSMAEARGAAYERSVIRLCKEWNMDTPRPMDIEWETHP